MKKTAAERRKEQIASLAKVLNPKSRVRRKREGEKILHATLIREFLHSLHLKQKRVNVLYGFLGVQSRISDQFFQIHLLDDLFAGQMLGSGCAKRSMKGTT